MIFFLLFFQSSASSPVRINYGAVMSTSENAPDARDIFVRDSVNITFRSVMRVRAVDIRGAAGSQMYVILLTIRLQHSTWRKRIRFLWSTYSQ